MNTKQAISVTLTPDNVTWLKGRVQAERFRSMSELLDQLIDAARNKGEGKARSVVGTVEIDAADPLLDSADDAIRSLFELYLEPVKNAKKRRGSTG